MADGRCAAIRSSRCRADASAAGAVEVGGVAVARRTHRAPTAGVVKIRRVAIGRGRAKALSAGTVEAGRALRRGGRRD
jgi:hypothetical protein